MRDTASLQEYLEREKAHRQWELQNDGIPLWFIAFVAIIILLSIAAVSVALLF